MDSREHEYLRLFKTVCKQINSSLDVGEVLRTITANAVRMLEVKGCTIFLIDNQSNTLEVSATYGLSDTYIRKGPLEADRSFADCLDGEWVHVRDVLADPRVQYADAARQEGIEAILSVPMIVKDRIIGVLRIYMTRARDFSVLDNEFISGLAEIGSIGIENARMHSHLQADYERLIADVHEWFEVRHSV